MKFINRKRELNTLKMILDRVKVGEGRTALIEGAAGIGKTALVEQFLGALKDVEILRGKCEVNSRYKPYSLFSQALSEYGSLRTIREVEEHRRIEDLAQDLVVRPRMIFVDEVDAGAAHMLFRAVTEHMEGLYFSPRMPEEKDGVWLTETKTELPRADPNNLEFSVIPQIYDFMESPDSRCIFIENINYLIYLNGIDRVVDFLHALYHLSEGAHTLLVSGRTEHLMEDEKNKLLSCFDEVISLDVPRKRKNPRVYMVDWSEEIESQNKVIFSSRVGVGKYQIGKAPLTPERLDFEIFDKIAYEMKHGNDVVLDSIAYLIHYHGIKKIYLWIKAIADYADKAQVNLYIVTKGLSEHYLDMLKDLVDESSAIRHTNYEDLQEVGAIKFYDAILSFLDYNSKKREIVLLLEDLQWADKSSLELLRYLTRNIMRSRIMIIATYRNEDIISDDETSEILEEIQVLDNTHIIRLNNLSREHVAELVRSIKEDATDKDIQTVYEKSEGNPLLAISIIDHLGSDAFVIPESIRESVELMLDSLDERSLYFLRLLAVAGDSVSVDVVEQLYPGWKRVFKKVQDKFVELRDDTIVFKYAPYREIIYSDIAKDTRMKMHLQIAELMEKRNDIVDTASHYYKARSQRALKYLKLAAEESIKDIALGDAIDYCKMALDIARKYGMKDELVRIYETLGDRYVLSGKYRNAIEMYENSLALGNKRKVSLGIKIGNAYERLGEYEKALEILEKYEKSARGIERGKIHGAIGIIKWHLGDFKDSEKRLKSYLKYARKYHSVEDEAEAYRNLAIVQYYYTKYDDGLKYAMRALDKANECGRYDLIANSYNVIGVIYERKAQFEEALQYFKKYLEISEKIGNFDYIAKAYNNLAIVYDYLGDVEKAKSYYLRSLEMNFKVGNRRDLAISYNNLAVVESEFGDSRKAIEYLKMSLKNAEEVNDTYNACTSYMNMGSFYMDIMDYESAIESLKRGLSIAERENYLSPYLTIATILASAYIEIGDLENAKKYIDIAREKLKPDEVDSRVSVMAAEIEYYMNTGDIDRAENILEDALKMVEEREDEDSMYYLMKYRAILRCKRKDYNYATIYFEKLLDYYQQKNKKKSLADIHFLYAECLSNFDKKRAKTHYTYARVYYNDMNNPRRARRVEERLQALLGEEK